MKAITLKSRIIILLTIFTILTTSIFITIQLAHEVKAVDRFIRYKTKTVSLSIEEKFNQIINSVTSQEKIDSLNQGLSLLQQTLESESPQEKKLGSLDKGLRFLKENLTSPATLEEKIPLMGKALQSLKESKSIQKAYILGENAKVAFSTEDWQREGQGDYDDLDILKKVKKGMSIRGETVINKTLRSMSVYIPVKSKEQTVLVVRVFFPLGDIDVALSQVYQPAIAVGLLLVVVNIFLAISLTRLIIKPIHTFHDAAKEIASGRLDLRVDISTNDELEDLANNFNYMTGELARMKERAENANPLTKLPGNIVIMEEVEKRIKESKKFTVIYCDLDNFKAFNDKYGIHKGDEAIILTSDIFKEAVKAKGDSSDFVGHEGGDDFLLVTDPKQAQAIADHITSTFDQKVRALYNAEDLKRGHIVAHARDGSVKKFPIMSISLAGITNAHREISNYAEVTNIAAEIKKLAKKEPGSCFVLNQRRGKKV
jgi:diguanylate cyclase (GGDEF)-like protein